MFEFWDAIINVLFSICLLPVYTTMTHVIISSDCYNKIPYTRWLIDNINLYLTILEAGKSKIKVPADLVSGEGHPLHTYAVAFPCVLTLWKRLGIPPETLL